LRTWFAITWIFEILAQMVDCIGQLNWLFTIIHGIDFLFSKILGIGKMSTVLDKFVLKFIIVIAIFVPFFIFD
jgi:hypothetical protein